ILLFALTFILGASLSASCSLSSLPLLFWPYFFFFNATATPEIYTLSLHDALPIFSRASFSPSAWSRRPRPRSSSAYSTRAKTKRSEEHTSELQSHLNLVCRLLLEKKKTKIKQNDTSPTEYT